MALPPSADNVCEAKRLAAEIRSRISSGTFCHSEYFPGIGTDGLPLTVGEHLDDWLAVQRIEPSTAAADASAVRFWKAAPCDDGGARLGDRSLHRLKACHVRDHRQQAPFPDPRSLEDVEAIVEYMADRYPPGVANLAEFKFFSGLRPSESATLRWTDVDLAAATLTALGPRHRRPYNTRHSDATMTLSRDDTRVLRITAGPLGRHATDHVRPLVGRRSKRNGDGSTGSIAATRFIHDLVPSASPAIASPRNYARAPIDVWPPVVALDVPARKPVLESTPPAMFAASCVVAVLDGLQTVGPAARSTADRQLQTDHQPTV